MAITNYEIKEDRLLIKSSKGIMSITPYKDTIIRVRYTLDRSFMAKESLMVEPNAQQHTSFTVKEVDDLIIFATEKLQVRINKTTAAFTYTDSSGKILTKEPEEGGKTLVPIEVNRMVYSDNAEIENTQTADGARAKATSGEKVFDRMAYQTKLEFDWADDEALYGLGSHEEGILNLRGTHQYLYQQNMKAVVPVFVSTKGYGILFESYSLMTFRDDQHGSYIWTDADDDMDFYFIYGPEFDEIVSEYRYLTGKAPLFPKWTFGYVQSKERYTSQEELISIVQEYRKRQIPLDLIVLDWMSWPGDKWGQKSFDPERFPNPTQMMADIHDLNAKLMVSIWPIMNNDGPDQLEMKEKGYLLGNQANYDAFNEEARRLYWQQTNEGLFSHGVDAWWCDCTEPFEADWGGEVKPEPEKRLLINTEEFKRYIDPGYINAYSLLHSKGLYEGQREQTSNKRVVNLTRSSFAGQQKYGAITWSGDISANWQTFRNQIADGLNMTVTGIPYWTTDIGGFFVRGGAEWFRDGDYPEGVDDLGYRELYTRWLQYATFLPLFRSHGTDTPREVWRFGEPGTQFYDTIVKYIKLRYQLLPYTYSVAGWVTHADYTMMRNLVFDFRHDPKTYDIKDQYLFGPYLLVNPVTQQMYYKSESKETKNIAKTRDVYLPKDTDWYNFWTEEKLEGGQFIKAKADLDTMPLYVKAGAILPLGPDIQYSSEQTDQPLHLKIYPGQDGEFLLYDDEGDNYNYERGEYATILIQWDEKNRRLTLNEREGEYAGMKNSVHLLVSLVDDKDNLKEQNLVYSGEEMSINF